LLVGQAAVILQRAQYLEVETVHRDHAVNASFVHRSCVF
jgi:hypothetical protein